MPKHEQYEELCTLAMIGELTAEEMQDLREHLRACPACQDEYREFTQFLLPQLSLSLDDAGTFETGYTLKDKQRLREEFLKRAEQEGISFTPEALRQTALLQAPSYAHPPATPIRVTSVSRALYRGALAASIGFLIFGAGYGTRFALVPRTRIVSESAPVQVASGKGAHDAQNDALASSVFREREEVDQKAIATLNQQLAQIKSQLSQAQQSLSAASAAQAASELEAREKGEQIAALESQAQGKDQTVAELQTEKTGLEQRVRDNQATVAANELRIRDLNDQLATQTASLSREREMLSAGRDVRDLMGARNLHIIDVHDANGAGKDKKSFGRVFYTEGKSLIFYAFDLDDKKVLNADYTFEAWGERLGQPNSIKSLGVLYVDDKTQRRWSLKVDNPERLSEINSVFVTLEPRKGEPGQPHGQKILYAFLGGEPNHP